jgi:Cu-Zn family superoxide dismutase
MKTVIKLSVLSIVVSLGLVACDNRDIPEEEPRLTSPPQLEDKEDYASPTIIKQAQAVLSPTQGNNASGSVTFTQMDNGVQVVADIMNLTPGEHGFHIHENGDCSSPDASSGGEHFNPTDMPHGGPESPRHHIGDLGNIVADASGRARMNKVFLFLSLNGDNSIVGKSIIVHSDRDDLVSQPSGDSGTRLACGVIRAEEQR